MKNELSIKIDQESGYEIVQWTNSEANDQHLYFTSPSVTDDDQYLIIISERDGNPNLYSIDRSTSEIQKLTNSKGLLKSYTYPLGKTEGLSKASPFLDSKNKILYWIEDDFIWKKDLTKNNRAQKVSNLPKGWLTGYTHISNDGKKFCVPCTDPKAFTKGDQTQHDQLKYVPSRMVNGGYKTKIIVVDLERSVYINEIEVPFWVTHVQFDPNDSDIILCNSEGTLPSSAKRDYPFWGRVWVVKADGSYKRLFNQVEGEYVNHENWYSDGQGVVYHGKRNQTFFKKICYLSMIALNKYGLNFFPRQKLDAMFSHYVAARNKEGKQIFSANISHPVSHAVAGSQGKNFIADSRDGYIYGYKKNDNNFEKILICNHGSSLRFQDAHPHPRVTYQGNSIIYTSDMNGSCNVYEVRLKDTI